MLPRGACVGCVREACGLPVVTVRDACLPLSLCLGDIFWMGRVPSGPIRAIRWASAVCALIMCSAARFISSSVGGTTEEPTIANHMYACT